MLKKPLILTILLSLFIFGNGNAKEEIRINCSPHSLYETFFIAVVNEVGKRLDITIEWGTPPVGRSLLLVNEGVDDGDGPRIAGLEKSYPNMVMVEEPFGEFHFGAFFKEDTVKITGWQSLNQYSVGFLRGWKIFEKNTDKYLDHLILDDKIRLFQLLDKERIDAVLCSKTVGQDVIDSLRLKGVHFALPPLVIKKNYLYLHKKHAALATEISSTLRQMKLDGSYETLYDTILQKED